ERTAPAGRDVRVLGHPQRLEAAVLGLAGQLVDADRVIGGEDANADMHEGLLRCGLGKEREVRVGGQPATVAPHQRHRAAPGAPERGAVRLEAERVPGGGHPGLIPDDRAAGLTVVHREVADVAPHLVPLGVHDALDALGHGRDSAEGHDLGRAHLPAALEVHRAYAGLPVTEPAAQGRDGIVGAHTKIDSGRNADTIQLGASTISLIFRSTATEHTMYASSRLSPRSRTMWSIM